MLLKAVARALLLPCVALGVTTVPARAEPVRLDAAAMDGITAGAAVDVRTEAFALGEIAFTSATTRTHAWNSERASVVLGIGSGTAVACCGSASQAASTISVTGEGDLVFAHAMSAHTLGAHALRGHAVSAHIPRAHGTDLQLRHATSRGIVIAIDLP